MKIILRTLKFIWDIIPSRVQSYEKQQFEFETDEYLKMAKLMKDERLKIVNAKIIISILEKRQEINKNDIKIIKDGISEKEEFLNKDIYDKIKDLWNK